MHFFKYQGAGNDFIFLDAFSEKVELTKEQITTLCDRKLGIGADGLVILSPSKEVDFIIDYFNADGSREGLCANATRCAFLFMYKKKKNEKSTPTHFQCYADGNKYEGIVYDTQRIALHFPDIQRWPRFLSPNTYYLHTGAPHKICIMPSPVSHLNVVEKGRPLRYDKDFPTGVNVNFMHFEESRQKLHVRTYEKGVEAETLSCGTGSVACALTLATYLSLMGAFTMDIHTLGGLLRVRAKTVEEGFQDIWLEGPAAYVFEGYCSLEK